MKRKNIYLLSLFSLLVFVFLQIYFSSLFPGNFFSEIGIFQISLITVCFLLFIVLQELPKNGIIIVICFYQIIFVAFLYIIYLFHYDSPFGYAPVDALYYHDIALKLQSMSITNSLKYLFINMSPGDIGFTVFLQFVYKLPVPYPVAIAKIFNIIFHLLSCYYIYKLTQLVFGEKRVSLQCLILYGINPISIYFNASGLKEPLFALIVILSFYYLYKAYKINSMILYTIGGVFALLTGLFRVAFPIFIFLSFSFYWFINTGGKYKIHKRFILTIVGLCMLLIAYKIVEAELGQKLRYDFIAIASGRLGSMPSVSDYIILTIGGVIGPFPSINYHISNDTNKLYAVGNYFKIVFSYFFVVATYILYNKKIKRVYPLYLSYFFNVVVLVGLAAALDYRFLYPFIPLYFIIISYGICNYNKNKKPIYLNYIVYYTVSFAIVFIYNVR